MLRGQASLRAWTRLRAWARARLRLWLRAWVPALLWMAVILWFSDQPSLRLSRVIPALAVWGRPPGRYIDFAASKAAHLAEYFILARLYRRGLAGVTAAAARPGVTAAAGGAPRRSTSLHTWAWALAVLYASTDEFHQLFVPGRTATLRDVLIDAAGAALGLWLWGRGPRREDPQPGQGGSRYG